MLVRDLIELLQAMPPDAFVVVELFGSTRNHENARVVDPVVTAKLGTHHPEREEWHWTPDVGGVGVTCVCLSPYFTE